MDSLVELLTTGLTLPPELIFVARCFVMLLAVDIMGILLQMLGVFRNIAK